MGYMCGIIGIIGLINTFALDSLYQLQNRGYDSAGLCTIINNSFKTIKYASDQTFALYSLKINLDKIQNSEKEICIGHTRWATHGEKTDINSHPHISMDSKIAIVHNGI